MKRWTNIAALVTLALVATPGAAVAKRPATSTELQEITTALNVPTDCVAVSVSERDSRWALAVLAIIADRCGDLNGSVVVHREGDGWMVRGDNGGEVPPCQGGTEVPLAIQREFEICRPRAAYILCNPGEQGDPEARFAYVKPKRCDTYGPREGFATSANLVRLRWRGWGGPTAFGTGVERGYHLPFSRIPVHIKAYRRRLDCEGDHIYTRLRITSRYGTLRVKFPRCESSLTGA